MADKQSRGDLTVKIDVDVSEALTGLKAVQREAREATKALRELESAIEVEIDGKAVGEAIQPSEKCVECNGNGFVSLGEGIRGVKKCVKCRPSFDLSEVPTKELSEELAKRAGVKEYTVEPHGSYAKLIIDKETHGFTEFIEGPAKIIVSKD